MSVHGKGVRLSDEQRLDWLRLIRSDKRWRKEPQYQGFSWIGSYGVQRLDNKAPAGAFWGLAPSRVAPAAK